MLAMSSVMWMSSSKITALLPLAPTCLPFEPQAAHATTYQTLFSLRRGPCPALQPTLRDRYQLVTESIPTAFGLVILAGGDPMRVVRYAANIGGDTDTIRAIAGAICGALRGIGAVDRALWPRSSASTDQPSNTLPVLLRRQAPLSSSSMERKRIVLVRSCTGTRRPF